MKILKIDKDKAQVELMKEDLYEIYDGLRLLKVQNIELQKAILEILGTIEKDEDKMRNEVRWADKEYYEDEKEL